MILYHLKPTNIIVINSVTHIPRHFTNPYAYLKYVEYWLNGIECRHWSDKDLNI